MYNVNIRYKNNSQLVEPLTLIIGDSGSNPG